MGGSTRGKDRGRRAERLSGATLREHLQFESPGVARLVRALRRVVLREAPGAAEGVRFGVLCYYHADAWFGAIGGNICMIEVRDAGSPERSRREVRLSFIHGAALPDPAGLLRGRGRSKRHVPVPDEGAAALSALATLIRRARDLRPWD